ncbi:MAG: MFS transporter [Syntrophomonadaceae bacterium]|nr:MFS transporter [Syntrophomonadaceae bacterium]
MEYIQKLWNWFTRKRIDLVDVALISVLVACAFFGYANMYKYDLSLDKNMALSNPWLVKTDNSGNSYVVDKERSRVVVIDETNQISRVINGCDPKGDTFYYPDNICVDHEGGIYIHDIWWSPTGFSLDGECIMYYNPQGEFDRYVYEVYYDDIYCDKPRIFAVTEYNDSVYFVVADETGFVLNSISPSSHEVSELASYALEEAITLIQDFVIDPAAKVIYAVDKRGMLLKAANGQVTKVQDVYAKAAENQKIALYRAAADNQGNVYVTDIASEQLLRFSRENDYDYSKVTDGSAIWNVAVNNETGLISFVRDGQIYVMDSSGEVILAGGEFEKSREYLVKEGLFDLLLLFAFLTTLYALLRILLVAITFKYSENGRIGVLIATSVLIVTAIIVSQLMGDFRTTYQDEILNKLEMSAQIVSNTTDIEALKSINSPRDYMNDNYKKLLSSITNTIDKKYAYSDDMYCNILKLEGDQAYAVAYIDNSIGAYFPLFDSEAEEVYQVYNTHQILLSSTVSETGSYIYVKAPICDNEQQVIGVVEVGTLSDVLDSSVNQMLREIAIPLIMIILVILFVFSELFSFFDLRSRYREEVEENRKAIPLHVVRLLVFITFLAFNMGTSFLPVYILKFVGLDIGIPRELAGSIPMSVNLIFLAITSLFCARLLNTYGFRRVAVFSGCLALCGDFTLAFAQNYLMIIVGLSLNGIGVGIITNAIHMYLASSKYGGDKDSGYGFSIFSAASLSGISCGMMFGAALAENLGQNNVFLMSTGVWLIVVFIFLFLGRGITLAREKNNSEEGNSLTLREFILNKNVLSFMALIQVPYIVMSAFIYYFVPIYANGQGLGETESCMLIMTSSLCSVYLSVGLTSYLSNKIKDNTIYLSSIITYIALVMFALNMTVPMLIVALIMIGVANSFGTPSRVGYFASSKEANAYGKNRAMGIYNFVDNIGESAGPIVLASIVSAGFLAGIVKLVIAFTGMNGLFALSRLSSGKSEDVTTGM